MIRRKPPQRLIQVEPVGKAPSNGGRDTGSPAHGFRNPRTCAPLRPGGREPVARVECRRGRRFAWLFRIDLAKPKVPMTLAKEAALDKAMAARQTCPGPCVRRYFHCIPLKTLGSCVECFDGTPADPASYIAPPAKHPLAA
ncbi:RRQRL motif-containing zinc-binding protein [Streptomyces sp. NPDC058357]|uniref:RRQRL motif-containing zinc-binding protein n=1 Tax=unclassified Streptomyces TaxID=2593676 RepID=UPI00366167E1